jgi:uncharacterized membrane protein
MHPTVKVALLWLGFAGSHMILSHVPIRRKLVQRLGEQPFRGLYSLVSFVFFVPLVWSYASAKHSGPWLWSISVGPVLQLFLNAAMGIAFILLAASFVQPSPASVVPGKPSAHGALRITRHPLFMSFVIFGLVHLVGNGSTTDVVFFGGFVLFTLVGAWHQDRRKLAEGTPGYREFCKEAPFLPFTGPQTATGIGELSPLVIAAGVALTIVVRYFHASWFGG